MPRIGDKLKIEVVPQGLKTGGKSLNEANQFGFSGFPTNLPEGPDNPYPFDFSGSGLFVAKAFAAYRATGYPFFLEFTVYGTVIDTSLSIFLQADYMTLPGPESEITVRIENRDLTTEEILHINDN